MVLSSLYQDKNLIGAPFFKGLSLYSAGWKTLSHPQIAAFSLPLKWALCSLLIVGNAIHTPFLAIYVPMALIGLMINALQKILRYFLKPAQPLADLPPQQKITDIVDMIAIGINRLNNRTFSGSEYRTDLMDQLIEDAKKGFDLTANQLIQKLLLNYCENEEINITNTINEQLNLLLVTQDKGDRHQINQSIEGHRQRAQDIRRYKAQVKKQSDFSANFDTLQKATGMIQKCGDSLVLYLFQKMYKEINFVVYTLDENNSPKTQENLPQEYLDLRDAKKEKPLIALLEKSDHSFGVQVFKNPLENKSASSE